MPPLFPHQRRFRGYAAAAIAGALAVLALLPLDRSPSAFPTCPFLSLTGLPCALCGGTRSAQALLHGEVTRALYLNPAGIPAVAILLLLAAALATEAIRGRPLLDWDHWLRKSGRLAPLAIALLFVWWIPHLIGALRTPKPELLDLRNPVAKAAYESIRRNPPPAEH